MSNETTRQHERLPVLPQLAILLLILGSLFGSLLLLQHLNTLPAEPELTSTQPTSQRLHTPAPAPLTLGDVSILGDAGFVWDVKDQRALYKKNPDLVLPLASITKLMTSLLTYELIAPEERAALPLAAILQSGDIGLIAGEEFTTENLHRLALISSSNDAAFALGATVGDALGERDPMAQFIAGMNIRAEELGLYTLHFKNTTGLDLSTAEPGAVGSARDVTFLLEYILQEYPNLLDTTTEHSAKVYNADGYYHEVFNTNELVGDIPNLLASKTGYTDLAGGNLTIAFDAGLNRPIIVTVLGSTREGRFADVATLIQATQATFSTQ